MNGNDIGEVAGPWIDCLFTKGCHDHLVDSVLGLALLISLAFGAFHLIRGHLKATLFFFMLALCGIMFLALSYRS